MTNIPSRSSDSAVDRSAWRSRSLAALMLLAGASCSNPAPAPPALDAARIASIRIGHSTRNEVFAALGQPDHTQQSSLGEAWVYEAKAPPSHGSSGLMNSAAAASGVVGAFVPYVGLLGSGLGLANSAVGGQPAAPKEDSLTVMFAASGIVRDCLYSSTALPAGVPGSKAAAGTSARCQGSPSSGTLSRAAASTAAQP